MADLCASLNSKAGSRDVEHAEVQDMNVEVRCGLRSYRPPVKVRVGDASVPVANGEADRLHSIRYQGRLFGSTQEVAQLVHPGMRTRGDNFADAPLRPTHPGSLSCSIWSVDEHGRSYRHHDRG